jgi:hypothetical protein
MTVFPKATPPPRPKTTNARLISLYYAIVLIVFIITQLSTFDGFVGWFLGLGIVGGATLAAYILAAEIFALPFLLGMKTSPAFRWFSLGMGWIAGILWALTTLWALTQATPTTIAFLGTLILTVPGWWAFIASLAMISMAAWASWGMWPIHHKK